MNNPEELQRKQKNDKNWIDRTVKRYKSPQKHRLNRR